MAGNISVYSFCLLGKRLYYVSYHDLKISNALCFSAMENILIFMDASLDLAAQFLLIFQTIKSDICTSWEIEIILFLMVMKSLERMRYIYNGYPLI